MRRAIDLLLYHVANLRELPHERVLRLQSAGGIENEYIDFATFRGCTSIECNGSRVAALLAFDDFNAQAIGPRFELRDGTSAECIARSQKDGLALASQRAAQLRNARGLSHAIHACDENNGGDRRACRSHAQRAILLRPQGSDFSFEVDECLIAAFHFAAAKVGTHAINEFGGGFYAHVGLQQSAFDFIDERFIKLATRENVAQALNARDDCVTRFLKSFFEAVNE